MTLFASARAYARKDELGGGYRGRARIGTEYIETEVHTEQHNAWVEIDRLVRARLGDRPFRYGHFRGNRYRKNYFTA
jgi:hypothetical protein